MNLNPGQFPTYESLFPVLINQITCLFLLLANLVISYPNCLRLIASITQYRIRYPRSLPRLSCTQLLIVLAPETFTIHGINPPTLSSTSLHFSKYLPLLSQLNYSEIKDIEEAFAGRQKPLYWKNIFSKTFFG